MTFFSYTPAMSYIQYIIIIHNTGLSEERIRARSVYGSLSSIPIHHYTYMIMCTRVFVRPYRWVHRQIGNRNKSIFSLNAITLQGLYIDIYIYTKKYNVKIFFSRENRLYLLCYTYTYAYPIKNTNVI